MSFDHSRQFIGASECASIVGLDSYRTKIAVWDRLVNGTISESSPLAERGRALEPGLVLFYEERVGRKIQAPVQPKMHPKYPFIGATPDGLDKTDDELLSIECKAPSWRTFHMWADGDIPPRYVIQMQTQCDVFGADGARCVVDLGDCVEIRQVGHDHDLANDILEQVAKFHRDYVVTKKPPPPDGSDSYSDFISRSFPKSLRAESIIADSRIEAVAMSYRAARDKLTAATEEADRLKQELQQAIGDARGVVGEFGSISWSDTSGRESVDMKALKAAFPEIAAQFTKRGESFRTFRASFKDAK